ncbi:MAG: hypothetical protein K1X78_14170 [Verrucomicrobiaceae bacterium]|nr:hypothetical protein [Verrucomicrobiaceae bacterium]
MKFETLKQRWYYFAPVVLLLIPLVLVAVFSVRFGYSVSESWLAVQHMGQSGTRYPIRYEERNFEKLKPGMDGRTVYQTMTVQPLEGQGGNEWKYSLPLEHAPYFHERLVIMQPDAQGVPRVNRVIKRFHIPAEK